MRVYRPVLFVRNLLLGVALCAVTACAPQNALRAEQGIGTHGLQQVAAFDHQATGVAVSETGRIFVNFPRWTEDAPLSVAEVNKDGNLTPYPNTEWNSWRNAEGKKKHPANHWVCVQSVVTDGKGGL